MKPSIKQLILLIVFASLIIPVVVLMIINVLLEKQPQIIREKERIAVLTHFVANNINSNIAHNAESLFSFIEGNQPIKSLLTESNGRPVAENQLLLIDNQWRDNAPEVIPLITAINNHPVSLQLINFQNKISDYYKTNIFAEIFITNKHGVNVAQTNQTSDYYQADENWWQQTAANNFFIEEPEFDESANILSRTISIKITGDSGDFLGILKAVVNLSYISSAIEEEEEEEEEAKIFLVSSENKIYATNQPDIQLFATLPSIDVKKLTSPQGVTQTAEKIIAYQLVSGQPFFDLKEYIVIERDLRDFILPFSARLYQQLPLISPFIALLLIAGFFVALSISKPLRQLQSVIDAISKGDFKKEISPRLLQSKNEVGNLARSFNRLLTSLKIAANITDLEPAKEKKKCEDALLFLDSIVENVPLMIFVKDAKELRFVRFNKAGEELLGYTRADLLGKNDYDFFPKDQADFFTAKDRGVLSEGKLVDIPEEPIDTRYKGKRWLHTIKVPVLDNQGNPLYLLGISEDITEKIKNSKVKT